MIKTEKTIKKRKTKKKMWDDDIMDETVRSKSLDTEKYQELYEKQVNNSINNDFPQYDINNITNPLQCVDMVPSDNISEELKKCYKRLDELYQSINTEREQFSSKLQKLFGHSISGYMCRIDYDKVCVYTDCVYPSLFDKLNSLGLEWSILSEIVEDKPKVKIVISKGDD